VVGLGPDAGISVAAVGSRSGRGALIDGIRPVIVQPGGCVFHRCSVGDDNGRYRWSSAARARSRVPIIGDIVYEIRQRTLQ